MRPIVQVIGWYGKYNLGDDLFMRSLHNLFPDFELHFSDGDIHENACAVMLGPGDVMDMEYLRKYDRSIPIVAFGVGFRNIEEVNILSEIDFSYISVRSNADYLLATNQGHSVALMADPVFSLYSEREGQVDVDNLSAGKVLMVCNEEINARWKSPSPAKLAAFSYATYFSEVLARGMSVLEQEFWTVWPIFSHRVPSDEAMTLDIASRMIPPLFNLDIARPDSDDEIHAIFSGARFCISMRFHGIVLALLHRRPVLALSIGRKMDSLMRDLGLENWLIATDTLSWEKLGEKLEEIKNISWDQYAPGGIAIEKIREIIFKKSVECTQILMEKIGARS